MIVGRDQCARFQILDREAVVNVPQGINRIITHEQPHLDELFAIFLLQRFGREMFPGIDHATIEFSRKASVANGSSTPEELEAQGILLIGIGGGRFDEHPVAGKPRKDGDCAASLVARAIRCHRRPELNRLLKYTTSNDLNGVTSTFELAEMVRLMNRQFPHNPYRVWTWTQQALSAYVDQQHAFFHEARIAIKNDGVLSTVTLDGAIHKVLSIQTEAAQVKAYAFSRNGAYHAVVVQRNGKGHVQVFSNKHYRLDLQGVVALIRRAELNAAGEEPDDASDYTTSGTMPEVPQWHYFLEGQMLLNGSMTDPDATPTLLSLEDVTSIVLKELLSLDPSPIVEE